MQKLAMMGLAAMLLAGAALQGAEATGGISKLPAPGKEHAWLQKFIGEWEYSANITMPGEAPQKSKGTESVRSLGGFWVIGESKGMFMDHSFTGIFTLGYDPLKNKYVETWVDSMSSHLWTYEGTFDAAGNVLTLEGEGPCPMAGGKIAKVKQVIEFKDKDHRVYTASTQKEDGTWATGMVIEYHRKGATVSAK